MSIRTFWKIVAYTQKNWDLDFLKVNTKIVQILSQKLKTIITRKIEAEGPALFSLNNTKKCHNLSVI